MDDEDFLWLPNRRRSNGIAVGRFRRALDLPLIKTLA
jgi:hypothetical protein